MNNIKMKRCFFFIIILVISCNQSRNEIFKVQKEVIEYQVQKKRQDEIIKKYVTNCAENYNYSYDMAKWQECLDLGLKEDSTIAYLWQQKAMPYFKAKKYEVGMKYLDKAVRYDRESWLPYRAFIKCIFAKTYKEAIIDFENCKMHYGNSYVMDHTYNFYIGLSYLQLNEYIKAEQLFEEYVNSNFNELGEDWGHPTALFYLGISKYELEKYEEAIVQFNRALKLHPNFADVKYYKAICLIKTGKPLEASNLYEEYLEDEKKGYTMNEDNIVYEVYPYQRKSHN